MVNVTIYSIHGTHGICKSCWLVIGECLCGSDAAEMCFRNLFQGDRLKNSGNLPVWASRDAHRDSSRGKSPNSSKNGKANSEPRDSWRNSFMVKAGSPSKRSALRKGRGHCLPGSTSGTWWRAAEKVSHGDPLIVAVTNPAWYRSISLAHCLWLHAQVPNMRCNCCIKRKHCHLEAQMRCPKLKTLMNILHVSGGHWTSEQ